MELSKNKVLDFRFPAVEDPYGGRHAPLRSAFMQAELAGKYSQYQNELMDNRARIDGTFVPQEQITRKEAQRAEELWNQKFRRGGNGRILVAEQAGAFVPARYPPTDLGPLKINQESLKRLANAFGVPEALLSKDATFANMQASLTLYARNTILPRVLILEQKLNEMLVPLYGDRLFLAAENPVPADEAFDLEKVQIAIHAGVLSREEIREATGFKPASTYSNSTQEANVLTTTETGNAIAALADTSATIASLEANPQAQRSADCATKSALTAEAFETAQSALSGRHDATNHSGGLLLAVNRAVAAGQMERAVAINLVMRELDVSGADARGLVGHRRIKRRKEFSKHPADSPDPSAVSPSTPSADVPRHTPAAVAPLSEGSSNEVKHDDATTPQII